MTRTYPIPPGLFCVPAAICAITGEDLLSRVMPALNRAQGNRMILGTVAGVRQHDTEAALQELGYRVFRYRKPNVRARLTTWAWRYPNTPLLVSTRGHMLVLHEGRVFDTQAPHGAPAAEHPYAHAIVFYAAQVQKK